MKKVQRRERAEQAGLKKEHQRNIKGSLFLDSPSGQHRHRNHNRRQQYHQHAQPIHTHEVFNPEIGNPSVAFDQLHASDLGIISGPNNKAQQEGDKLANSAICLAKPRWKPDKARITIPATSGSSVRIVISGMPFIAHTPTPRSKPTRPAQRR